jgi:hypothetical protein
MPSVASAPHHDETLTQEQLKELRRNLSLLSTPRLLDFYQDAYKECAAERKAHRPCNSATRYGLENSAEMELAVKPLCPPTNRAALIAIWARGRQRAEAEANVSPPIPALTDLDVSNSRALCVRQRN